MTSARPAANAVEEESLLHLRDDLVEYCLESAGGVTKHRDVVVISTDGVRFPVNRVIRSHRSTYFGNLLSPNFKEASRRQVELAFSSSELLLVPDFLISGTLNFTGRTCLKQAMELVSLEKIADFIDHQACSVP